MSFAEFVEQIKSDALRQVAQHWNDARCRRTMPDWCDLKPAAIAAHLPMIWSYRYDRERDMLVGRLAGDKVEKVFGRTFRGTPMQDLYPAAQFKLMFERFRRVVLGPAFYIEEGEVFRVVDHYGVGERIAMPLSPDGKTANGILGATDYHMFSLSEALPEPTEVRWFAL